MTWLSDPNDERVQESLTRSCDICQAKPATLCTNTIQPGQPLRGRTVHIGRLTER